MLGKHPVGGGADKGRVSENLSSSEPHLREWMHLSGGGGGGDCGLAEKEPNGQTGPGPQTAVPRGHSRMSAVHSLRGLEGGMETFLSQGETFHRAWVSENHRASSSWAACRL